MIKDKTNVEIEKSITQYLVSISAGLGLVLGVLIVIAITLLFSPVCKAADSIDITIGSHHIKEKPWYRELGNGGNPGVGYSYNLDGVSYLTGGAYTNSNDNTTVYFGMGSEADYGSFGLGGIFLGVTGYARSSLFKLTVATFPYLRLGKKTLPVNLRISHIPGIVTGFQLIWNIER